MRFALDLVYLLGLILASPWLAWRGLRQRGKVRAARRPAAGAWPARAVWLHGSSVGEVSLIRPLVEQLTQARPDVPVVISSHTATGVEAAQRAYPSQSVFRFPADLSFVQRRLLRDMQPALIVIVESDLWPNQLLAARDAGVPVAIVNGKLSERSARRHRWTRLIPRALRHVSVVAVQNDIHAARFASLGVEQERIRVTGNMKYDLTVDADTRALRQDLRARLGCAEQDVLIIGGSLHLPEDRDLLAAFCANRAAMPAGEPLPRLVLVPRYPQEVPRVCESVAKSGLQPVPYSKLVAAAGVPPAPEQVVVVDVLGELRKLYAAADIAFVGGSLHYRGANKGGHNLMEPAILGLPVLFGPYNFSFKDTVADLLAADAGIQVRDRSELSACLTSLIRERGRRELLGQRAREVVLNGQGASLRNLDLLLGLLDSSRSCSVSADNAQCRHQSPSHITE